MKNENLAIYLKSTEFINADHQAVQEFAKNVTLGTNDETEKVKHLYYAVRDGFRYDPYRLDFSKEAMKASSLLTRDYGYCVEKSCLFAAACRVIGIPSRLGFANVRNHIGTAKLEAVLQTDVLVFHGYAEIYLNGKWIKVTPVFNKELCEKLNVIPLEFNPDGDSVFQEYDQNGGLFMEYLHQYGHFEDIPYEFFISELIKNYPHLASQISERNLLHIK
ncbi:transglutaminase-like domain-containing protein [Marivirga salinae]|uniref:Transglutaminase-like domain-containing protein n=1 Tax=Marivirga salinarum TaxID=3059078 RepID=A0AA49GFI8_9BACT|nr:transglutaminase-like domain-containing protein [Marivirga sp. BDSF4-3]WKK78275.2 transglutaminase-like domain-containing protein [Marivirga sp. BDSF4-3]